MYSIECHGDIRVGDQIRTEMVVIRGGKGSKRGWTELLEGRVVEEGKTRTPRVFYWVEVDEGRRVRVLAADLLRAPVYRMRRPEESPR